jgi:hypothetical protein
MNNTMINIEESKIEYLNIEILKNEINNIKENPLQRNSNFQLEYNVKMAHFYNLEKKLIRVIIDVDIIALNGDDRLSAGAKFEIDNYFHYSDLKKFAHPEKDRVLIELRFVEIVKGLAYSTARGIIHSKLAGTFLENTILPVKMSTDV